MNININKVYYANDDEPIYIGKSIMASNSNYLVHLIENIITGIQFLRVYCRKANYFNTVKYDYVMPKTSRTNFYVFPNYYLNIIWYRDEKFVNSTAFSDHKIVLDANASALVAKYD